MDREKLIKYETMEKLCLTDEEREFALKAMGILEESFNELARMDAGDAPPLVSVVGLENVLREDVQGKTISRDELLSNAPEEYYGYYQVPKVIDNA